MALLPRQVLASQSPTVAPVASFNNEIGLPLTVLETDESTRYLVLELGSSAPGHIAYLTEIAPLDAAAVLMVGHAHMGGFGSLEVVADAKAEIVRGLLPTGTAVLNLDDPRTAAGQGTAIAEAVEQLGFVPDVVILPVGGGGLMSGAAAWLRTHHPQVRIIGVEPDGAPCVAAAISAGRPFPLNNIDTFVDGAAVSLVGDYTFGVINEAKIELTRIPEGQVCSEMLDMYQTDGIIAEPAGALAAAALPTGGVGTRVHIPGGSRVLSVVSGGNNDVARYADIVERSLLHEGRKHYFLVNFPQQPGALRRFLDEVLGPDDDITYFEYVKRSSREVGPALVGVELSNPGDYRFLLARITECGMEVNEVDSTSPYFRFLV